MDDDNPRNNHIVRMEAIICGALKSAIDAHGPLTKELVGSACKRIICQLVAHGKTRVAVPVITNEQMRRLESVAEMFGRAFELAEELDVSLSVLRDDNHPEGWSEIEFCERADVPVAIVHHHRLQRATKQYKRKRDGKVVPLRDEDDDGDSMEAAEYPNQAGGGAQDKGRAARFKPTIESPSLLDAVDPVGGRGTEGPTRD